MSFDKKIIPNIATKTGIGFFYHLIKFHKRFTYRLYCIVRKIFLLQ